MNKKHIGDSFDDFLKEQGIFEEIEARAFKKVITIQIQKEMQKKKLTKKSMAEKMGTSRSCLDRLLDPDNEAITFKTLKKAAVVLDKQLVVQLA